MLYAKFGWNWPSCSGEEGFYISLIHFRYFKIISHWKRLCPFIWINLISFHPRMLWAKFGWNWLSWSGEEDFKILSMYFRYFIIISPSKRLWPVIWIKFNPLYPRIRWAKFGWNWQNSSGEEGLYILLIHFCYFIIISNWKRMWPFIWTNLNSLHPRMCCAKFGWNWPSGSGEDQNMKSLQTDNSRQAITKAQLSFQIRW